ncbi:T9SS type A sorting domain-containing protein [Ferruginibacter sp. HRS2-29]|uniref:T9SS type A sorting domain-containing protein n=1 Tax=Ferruginibacter sp. HRS2-29 TaxID=2487334 RepID=UPI0020CE03B6|nr:T9SS type A sorting domain-containing protein [Ferruginibacter sp. HRS2-29]
MFSFKASAQGKHSLPLIKTEAFPFKKNLLVEAENTQRVISGIVKDSSSNAISFATVSVSGTKNIVVSDFYGKFSISIKNDFDSLSANAYGFFETQIALPKTEDSIVITLKRNFEKLTEVVVVGGISPSYYRKKARKIAATPVKKDNIIFIYPNPAKAAGFLTIKWDSLVKSDQYIEIYDISGKLVQSEIRHINNKSSQEKINLNLLQAGHYVIKITDAKTNKSQSLNFIAE